MLQPILETLNSKRIVLASGSPRRAELLRQVGLKFEVVPSEFDEDLDKSSYPHPWDYVSETAYRKTKEVSDRLRKEEQGKKVDLVIGADTVVTSGDGKVLEKPRDQKEAIEMLTKLRGRTHRVYTGVAIINIGPLASQNITFHSATEVQMANYPPDVIQEYVNTGEPMDKAGAYGIQGVGSTLIERINGDYYTVMGLPLHRLCLHLRSICGCKPYEPGKPGDHA